MFEKLALMLFGLMIGIAIYVKQDYTLAILITVAGLWVAVVDLKDGDPDG